MRYTLAFLLLALVAGPRRAVADPPIPRQEVRLATAADEPVRLAHWAFLPADLGRSETAAPGPMASDEIPGDEAHWVPATSRLGSDDLPDDWAGAGWFAVDLALPPESSVEALALRFTRHHGASRIYLDGSLAAGVGTIAGEESDSWVPSPAYEPVPLIIDSPGRHRLRILYANPSVERFHRVGYIGGFQAEIVPLGVALTDLARRQRVESGRRSLFAAVFLSFGLLHFLLWVFRRASRDNLYFALMSLALAVLAFLLSHKAVGSDPRILFWSESAMNAAGIGFAVFGVLFVHTTFHGGFSRRLRWLALPLAALLVWAVGWPKSAEGIVFLVMLAGLVEMGRAVVVAVFRRRPGARIVASGILFVVLGFGAGLLANLGALPRVSALTFTAPFVSVLLLTVSMSVYLAWRVSETHRDLELQLDRVRTLSAERLEQERRIGEERTRRTLLEAEVERKREELEEARQLQLSMLPRHLPEHGELEVAVHMTTATEVGGDYYDFDLDEEGGLTVAVGDATGHGMRAGTMVTATKSLFNALGGDSDLLAVVRRSNLALKRMNLRMLNMALLLARYREGRLELISAGMPFPLVLRDSTGALECIEIGGMPLGTVRTFPYRSQTVPLGSGDTVLFMSDGFPELLSPEGEMLGYDRAADHLRRLAGRPAHAIIEGLVGAAEAWGDGREPEDDITFVVLKGR